MGLPSNRASFLALLVLLAAGMVLSASCGCGSKSSGPPLPSRPAPAPQGGSPYIEPPLVYYDSQHTHDWQDDAFRDPYYLYPEPANRLPSDWEGEYSRERWCLAHNYLGRMGYSRIVRGADYDVEEWGSLYFWPVQQPGSVSTADMAYAIYAIPSRDFAPFRTHLRLFWQELYTPYSEVWIGLRAFGGDGSWWEWHHPDDRMKFDLTSLRQYQATDYRGTIYITIVVGGEQRAVLDSLVLRESLW